MRNQDYECWRPFLRTSLSWPREQVEAWQLGELQRIVRYAFENTAGYRELYNTAGVKPDDIRSLSDIRHLPITEKKHFQDNLEAFSVKGPGRAYCTTGGSTGIPLGFYSFRNLRHIERAFVHESWERFGWKPGSRTAVLRGGFVGTKQMPWMYDPYRRELHLSSYHLSHSTLPVYIDVLRKYGVHVLQAYPSSLNLLCNILRESGLSGSLPINIILLASENAYSWQLAQAAKVFPGATLFDFYGQSEHVIFAGWCRHAGSYHINPFYGVTELLHANGATAPGQTGELIGTSFHNLATPFIRYRTMDTAVRAPNGCEGCSRDWDMLTRIEGRKHEWLVTHTGRHISMTSINMHDRVFDPILQFQFYQDSPGLLAFRYIPRAPLSLAEERFIRRSLAAKLGDDVELTLEPVAAIPLTRAGKLKMLDQRLEVELATPIELRS